jgi:uncharacterized Zn-binding protein involved in type VI secretion
MRNVIRLGDSTSHGGAVISTAASHYVVGGKPVAGVGDTCSCPIPGHGTVQIVEGDPSHTVNGVAISFHGHKTSCGAALISSTDEYWRS